MEYILAIVAALMVIGFVIYVCYKKYRDAEKQRAEKEWQYRQDHPMVYESTAYRFSSRIKEVQERIQAFENIDYVGAKDVIGKIKYHLSIIIQQLTDDKFNAFVKANSGELGRALSILNGRLKSIEDACNKLAHAITIQELDPHKGSKEIKSIVNEAEEILSKQLNEEEMSTKYMENATEILEREAELMRKVDQMQ